MKPENAKKTVLVFLTALNEENFKAARAFANDNMKFQGVLGKRDNADSYFEDMAKMKFKYEILKVFADGDDVCVFYNIDMSGTKVFTCGWYQLENDKISNIKVIFDPRPVLEQSNKK
ncbi:MAG TPA: nuclear transport factor 2 family protein [Flavobacterium sp.]|nr:nuclear transport factor 2 family protein [Flavobacterium sp.]